MVMSGPNGAEAVPRQWATAGIFDALGVEPIVGRTFLAADDTERANVVVLSEAFWRTRFGADPGIVGQSMRFDGEPFTVVGVVPDQAELLASDEHLGVETSFKEFRKRARRSYGLQTVARLKPGVSLEAARDDARGNRGGSRTRISRRRTKAAAWRSSRCATSCSARELKRTSLLFLGVVGFVLLICFANIANLLLTRNAARGNELAIRSVLGADRRRLVRQFATENLLLAAVGGLAGLGVGRACCCASRPSRFPQELLPAGFALDLDWRVAAFCAGATLLVAALFTLASAAPSRGVLVAARKRAGRAHGDGSLEPARAKCSSSRKSPRPSCCSTARAC